MPAAYSKSGALLNQLMITSPGSTSLSGIGQRIPLNSPFSKGDFYPPFSKGGQGDLDSKLALMGHPTPRKRGSAPLDSPDFTNM